MFFDMTETEMEKLMKLLDEYNIDFTLMPLFDEDSDDEVGLRLVVNETIFNAKREE